MNQSKSDPEPIWEHIKAGNSFGPGKKIVEN